MKKWRQKRSLRVRLTLLVMAELLITVALASVFSDLLHWIFGDGYDPPRFLELCLIGLMVGGGLTQFMGRVFFDRINMLGDAMNKVAEGDFSVHLEADNSIPEIENIYNKFNLMVKELNATEVLQTDFVSNVSHEFKTPINAIEGYATLLQDKEGLSPDEQEQYVDKILFNTQKLSSLVGNILLLSRIDNQAIPHKGAPFRLDEQIRQAIVLLEPEWVKKDIEFDVEMQDITIEGNENLLFHVWNNLIGNAIKFDPPNGLINIKLHKKGDKAVFQIEDSGPGISEEGLKHIFDKFYQEDSSHKQEGNGLGLALAGRIVSLHGGSITAENLPGGGCRFTVELKV
ncbi:MAG: HAMP domain-containing histidine kinase [Clostridia bacterium]|nr:HAMP domain-containing histidine kinase [Clostridia bacterium]